MSKIADILSVARCFLTLPGTLHASSWELIATSAAHIPLHTGECIRRDRDCGRLLFEQPDSLGKSFLVCALPFAMNILLGIPILLTSTVNLFVMRDFAMLEWLMLWVGLSLFSSAYPTGQSAKHLWDLVFHRKTNLFVTIVLAVPTALLRAGAWLNRYWLTLPLAAGGAALMPLLLKFLLV